MARRKGIPLNARNDVTARIPNAIKEAAIMELARRNYNINEIEDIKRTLQPTNGSAWSRSEKAKYHEEMFRYRKDLRAVSKSLNIPFATCMAYYLNEYKHSKDYLVLKSIRKAERQRKIESLGHVIDKCGVCGEGGCLLICDECEGEYHMGCLNPPLAVVPEGRWECDQCVGKMSPSASNSSKVHSTSYVDKRLINGRNSQSRSKAVYQKMPKNDDITMKVSNV